MSKPKIAFISSNPDNIVEFSHLFKEHFEIYHFDNIFNFIQWINNNDSVSLIVTQSDLLGVNGITLRKNCKTIPKTTNVPFVIIVERYTPSNRSIALHEQFADIFESPLNADLFLERANYLIQNPPRYHKSILQNTLEFPRYRMPLDKRIFDIVLATLALLFLLPLFLLIAIIIRLESKGPVFYTSKRVGTGYKVFDFYKFRSMKTGADSLVNDLRHLNQYADKESVMKINTLKNFLCDECKELNISCRSLLYMDGEQICDKVFGEYKQIKDGANFFKIENDPRITKIGNFIRNTSIDELPQLLNVIKGDMSLVGNRPLPLYEAEKLTTDQFTMRFLAPAGITGLWQVTQRGKGGKMSAEERMELDNEYAKNYSLFNDIKLIFRTIPALFQNDNG